MEQNISTNPEDSASERKMLGDSGYSEKAIDYFLKKPHGGSISDATHATEMTGSCGDTMKIFLKLDNNNIIEDAKYQVLGCPGAVASAMATVDLVKGKSVDYARTITDGHVYEKLGEIPVKKHHCIQLSVKTLHHAIDEYTREKAAS